MEDEFVQKEKNVLQRLREEATPGSKEATEVEVCNVSSWLL